MFFVAGPVPLDNSVSKVSLAPHAALAVDLQASLLGHEKALLLHCLK